MWLWSDIMAGTLAAGYIALIIAIYVLFIVAWWRLFEKAGEPGWASLIPLYNTYELYKIAWGNGWLFLLLLVPLVNIIMDIILQVKLAKAFGYPGAFALGLIFLPNIFQLIMGFDNSQYLGPQ